MTALLERPLFTWITLEHRATLDGRITVHYEPYLVLDRIAVNAFVAQVGARKWRILETLALLSEPDPAHALRRVVKANIPDLLAVCAGPDGGWSRSTMSSVIKSMEDDGYLVRVLGAKLGRGGGQDDTTWILADGLFALPQPAVMNDVDDARAKSTTVKDASAEYCDTQKPDAIPVPDPLTENGIQFSDTQMLNAHHEETWMKETSMTMMNTPAFLADDTTNDMLTLAVSRALRRHGWTTDINAAIRTHGLLRIAAFIVYAEHPANKVAKPGGFIRSSLLRDPHVWPDQWELGTRISVTATGTITALSPTDHSPSLPQAISTAQVMEIFTTLPPTEQQRLRSAAAPLLPADPAARADVWRQYLADVFTATGLLEVAS